MEEFAVRLRENEEPMRIHLVGVAGSGMSGLALLLLEMGHLVSGSDRVTSAETERLQGKGLIFSCPHSEESVADAEVVVFSSAIRPENPALVAARVQGLKILRRAECLAAILHGKKGVVVSGTHGKTTTSAMCAHVLRKGGREVSHYVGAEIPVLGANARWTAESEYLVAEGDESDGTLALYRPSHSIVLNVEAEHLDFYRDLDHIKEVFQKLLSQTSERVIYCAEDAGAVALCASNPVALSYGWAEADFTATEVVEGKGVTSFTVSHRDEVLGRVELGIPGRHNVLNALAAIALAVDVGVDFQLVARALASFAGAKRRFETGYVSSNFRIIDDYGHHPTEVAATLQTARSLKPGRLVVLFQPHRFSRTQRLAADFGEAFQAADVVYVTDIYPASEDPIPGVTGQTIVDAVKACGETESHSLPDLATAHYRLGNDLEAGDLVITLGAGNVHEAGKKLARDLRVMEELQREESGDEMKVRLYEPMRRHTTMLVGGPAQFWIEPRTFSAFSSAVSFFKERGIPMRVVGRGSNLLVRDGGIRGAVIHPSKGEFDEVTVEGDCLTAGAGVRLKKLASAAEAAGLGGLEWMEGVPGNVGGSLRMNAGAMGTETFDQVVSVTILDEDGEIHTKAGTEIESFYRNVPELRRHYVLKAVLRGNAEAADVIRTRMEDSKQKRRSSQPLAASAGCVFKNPEGIGAGQLVDELGLKGSGVGKAEVSLEHGNFIVNRGQATATNVLELIEQIRAQAKEDRGTDLELEVQVLGEDEVNF